MTEDEAKTKWCPLVRQKDDNGSYNRNDNYCAREEIYCIASRCMMWEPYEYWQTEDGKAYSSQVKYSKLITGGDCGLKSKDLECRGF